MSRTVVALALLVILWPRPAWAGDSLVVKGQQVYAAQKCSMCHSVAGKGNPKGSLDTVGTKWTADQIRRWIVASKEMAETHRATRKPPMPGFSKLSTGEVDALVAYLQTLK